MVEENDVTKWTESQWTTDYELFCMQPTGMAIDMAGGAGA